MLLLEYKGIMEKVDLGCSMRRLAKRRLAGLKRAVKLASLGGGGGEEERPVS